MHGTHAAELPAEDVLGAEDGGAIEPLPSLLLSKGPVSAETTSLEIKPEVKPEEEEAAPAQPALLEGGSESSAEVAVDVPHITYDDSVPGSLRYGPRELRHMQALGLIPKAGAPPTAPAASAPTPPSAGAAKDEADARAEIKAQRKKARQAQKQAEKLDASLKVRAFLDRHGFETVKSKKSHLFRAHYPLHAAVRENDADMVALLLRAGASYRKTDSASRSPLELAQYLNTRGGSHAEVITILQSDPTVGENRTSTSSASSSGPHGT